MENGMVTISVEKFEELMKCKVQIDALVRYTNASKYISREDIAMILDFELVKYE